MVSVLDHRPASMPVQQITAPAPAATAIHIANVNVSYPVGKKTHKTILNGVELEIAEGGRPAAANPHSCA